MTRMIPIILCLSLHWIAQSLQAAQAENYLVYGIPNYPPFSVYEEQGFSGRDVELVLHLADKLNLQIRFSPCEWIRCLELARAGRVDILTSVSHAQEREAFLHFIQPAYSRSNIAFWVRSGEAERIRTFADLDNKIVGKEKGARLFAQVDNALNIQRYESAQFNILFKMLVSGRLDTVMGGDQAIAIAVERSGYAELLEPAVYKVQVPSAFLAMARQSAKATVFLIPFQDEMQRMYNSGELNYYLDWQEPKKDDN
ncbi:substrate-binding periplasmic protein [Planctobacterium marinum]|uniref:substrate-binding periplasmic protein n=1 Tax=Planctobacterium marinum TaxID=1631968 RepID=UPI001E6072B3|nr:transporter substrate-binding domain-containing protein [Planctobacterium marinum]MCC2607016.1 transporter substrate-binding domain-containing protein [Planctobacterium marinum]